MIRLEPLQVENFQKIVEWNEGHTIEFLNQWAGPVYEYPLTREQIERYYEDYITKEKDTLFVYQIINEETNEMIGTIELDVKDTVNKVGRIARFLIGDEKFRGKGTGKEALLKALKFGFENLKLNKITLGVYDFNTRALRCYEKVGFIIEELKENYRVVNNNCWNLYNMAITLEQWRISKT